MFLPKCLAIAFNLARLSHVIQQVLFLITIQWHLTRRETRMQTTITNNKNSTPLFLCTFLISFVTLPSKVCHCWLTIPSQKEQLLTTAGFTCL
jgi:hypothetical protein